MSEKEPVDTTLPWARPKREPLSQVEYERQAYEAMTKPGGGKIHKMSLTTPTYEPNRAMVKESNDIIQKKGKRQPGYNDIRKPDTADRAVVVVVVTCLVLMLSILGYVLTKLG